ncbi:hypothetical protein ACFL5B_01025 [Candidatus Latescibacterota bacterium]
MSEKMSPETQEKINDLCGQISVAHNLDEEIHEELRCHMEDKLLGYLSGDEKLTAEDAFILVREHFGDPEIIKRIYHNVETLTIYNILARKIGAAFVATLGVGIVISIFNLLSQLFFTHSKFIFKGNYQEAFATFTFYTCILLSPLFLLRILINWRKKLKDGQNIWFFTISPIKYVFTIVILLIIHTFLPFINYHNILQLKLPYTLNTVNLSWILLSGKITEFSFITIIFMLYFAFYSFVWLWWCDTSPHRLKSLMIGTVAWLLYFSHILNLQPFTFILHDSQTKDIIVHAKWVWFLPHFDYVNSLFSLTVVGIVSLFIYTYIVGICNIRSKTHPVLSDKQTL